MHSKQRVVVLSGAGMSAESGLKTFRGAGGLWEGHRVEEVATPEAWAEDPERVLRFYNERRQQLRRVQPNVGHQALADLELAYSVQIVTQNVDDLHERAGSTAVLHLHGELMQARSTVDPALIYELEGRDIALGDTCTHGSQLRPNIVWFGEGVPAIGPATQIVEQADILMVVGSSLAVYPAAALVHDAPKYARCYYVDPSPAEVPGMGAFEVIAEKAASALPQLVEKLLAEV